MREIEREKKKKREIGKRRTNNDLEPANINCKTLHIFLSAHLL